MISFDPLWRTLSQRGMKEGDRQELTGLSSSTMAKLSKNETVKTDVIDRVCEALKCPISDVIMILPDQRR